VLLTMQAPHPSQFYYHDRNKKKKILRIFKFCKGYDMYSIVSIQDLL